MTNELKEPEHLVQALPDEWRHFALHEALPLGGELQMTLSEVAEGWLVHVNRFLQEQHMRLSDDSWNADDFVAAIALRSLVATALERTPHAARGPASAWIARVDDAFKALTEPDGENLLSLVVRDDLAQRPWWWHRIPKQGPVREDLARYRPLA